MRKKPLTRRLIASFLTVFSILFFSCKPQDKLSTNYSVKTDKPKEFFKVDSLYKFHMEVNAYDRSITGILFIKRTTADQYKVVFANESGFQLMALLFEDGKMKKHEVFKKLDKKIILKTIEKGIGMLFYGSLCEDVYLNPDENSIVECQNEDLSYRYLSSSIGLIERIEAKKDQKLIKWIEFHDHLDGIPQNINIQHEDIRMSYKLKAL